MTALGLVDATRNHIKMLGGGYTERVTITDKTVTVHGDGADLTESLQGEIVHVEGTANVSIVGLRIHNGLGTSGDGILCINAGANNPTLTLSRSTVDTNGGVGINATKCTLAVTQSTIGSNTGVGIASSGGTLTITQSTLSRNTGGGIALTSAATFAIVGNMFFSNGSGTASTTTGGVSILTTQSPTNRLEFNSFNKNQAQDNIGTAIHCFAGMFTSRNNAMSGNGTLSNMEQTGGSCIHAYSIALPGMLPMGNTNIARDPLFRDTTTGDLHIQSGSPAIRAAAPDSDLTGIAAHDLDGDARISPADIGADQLPR